MTGVVPQDQTVLAALTSAPAIAAHHRGHDDPLLDANRAHHRGLAQAGIAHGYAEAPGGHDWTYWSTDLESTLRFFGGVLNRLEHNP